MEPLSISSLLETAAANTAKAEFQETSEKVARLRATLDAFEKVAWKHAERQVVERVFAALGAAPPESGTSAKELAEVREALGVALVAVLKLVGWESASVPKDCAPAVLVAPPRPLPPPPPSVPALRDAPKAAPPRPLPIASPEDIEHAKRVLDEIEELRGQDFAKQSPLRLLPLLQAVAAEARLLVERLPAHHPYHRDLIDRFSRILEIKETAGVSEYVNGLSHTARGDWAKIAVESRKAVARFDKNVTQALEQAAAKKKAKEEEPREPDVVTESRFPLLVQYTSNHGPLLLIGGMKIDERLDQVARNHGFECEWVEIPKNSPRSVESTTARIASGKIGIVVILEHFMSHPVYKALTKACDVSKVNYATAGKGGKGTLDLAFMALEKRLSA